MERVARKIAYNAVERSEAADEIAAAAAAAAGGGVEEGKAGSEQVSTTAETASKLTVTVTAADLEGYVGKPKFSQVRLVVCLLNPCMYVRLRMLVRFLHRLLLVCVFC